MVTIWHVRAEKTIFFKQDDEDNCLNQILIRNKPNTLMTVLLSCYNEFNKIISKRQLKLQMKYRLQKTQLHNYVSAASYRRSNKQRTRSSFFWLCLVLISLLYTSTKTINLFATAIPASSSSSSNDSKNSNNNMNVNGDTTSSSSNSRPDMIVMANLPEYGRILGKREQAIDFFGGIPYAAPPVGPLRWAPPESAAPWAPAKLDATQFGPDCWQLVDPLLNPVADIRQMSEDCLYLNVYTPAGASSSRSHIKLPVMVWLHGGAFQQGGARRPEYDGRRLAERGTVVVTINYRLGALGFLVSSADGLFGNFGLMDQRAALHWVRENVQNFGGDPDNITLFGESAGAVMTVLHLMMEKNGGGNGGGGSEYDSKFNKIIHKQKKRRKKRLFHKAIIQSNPLGLQFRSVVVADFIGEALKRSVDCRDLACLRAERVEEIMRAQSSLMGIPRSVGDFFTWGPTLTQELKITIGAPSSSSQSREQAQGGTGGSVSGNQEYLSSSSNGQTSHQSSSSGFFISSKSMTSREHIMFRDLDSWKWQANKDNSWTAVNVTQPLKYFDYIPDDIPIILGVNKHEGEMFVHSAFPITMTKAVYWMFVGALFRDSASRVLKHYRGYVDQIEKEAEDLARKQIQEEECRQFYLENREELDREYQYLLELNTSTSSASENKATNQNAVPVTGYEALVNTWSGGGGAFNEKHINFYSKTRNNRKSEIVNMNARINNQCPWYEKLLFWRGEEWELRVAEKRRLNEERKMMRAKDRALKEAAKVVVDYRPVMSRIVDDYLFRCPTWNLAHKLSRRRLERGQSKNNVFVYQFSHSTHIPGYKECWGKACHTAELPFVFQAMDIIRSNYSTLGPYAQQEAPENPEYPYTDILAAYRDAMEAAERVALTNGPDDAGPICPLDENTGLSGSVSSGSNSAQQQHSRGFQRLLNHFFGDYFKEDADEEIASDMADRWVSFARSGDPNFVGSKADWRPWRKVFDDDLVPEEGRMWQPEDFDEIFDLNGIVDTVTNDINNTNVEGDFWFDDPEDRMYRRRALIALGMEVVEEDVFKTLLRRTKYKEETDNPFHTFLNRLGGSPIQQQKRGGKEKHMRRAIRQLQQIAQEMGFIGTGIRGEPRRGPTSDFWEDAFFPEILELKWPPEGRLVERDCTCDMWDRIRYRY